MYRGKEMTMGEPHSLEGRRSLRTLILVLSALLLLAAGLPSPVRGASFQVSPTRFEFPLDKRFTNFFTVTNTSATRLRLRAYVAFLDVSENNTLVPVKGNPLDLSQYVVINPRKFSLGAGGKRVVRFSVRPPPVIEQGEYRAVVFFDELPEGSAQAPSDSSTSGAPGSLGSVRIKLLTRLGITLYGMKGEKEPGATLANAEFSQDDQGVLVRGRAINTGNVRVTLNLHARMMEGEERDIASREIKLVVQRNQWREFSIRLIKPDIPDYRVILTGADGDRVYFEQEWKPGR